MIGQSEPLQPFEINRDMEEGPSLTWKFLTHPGTYIRTIGVIFVVCIGICCLKKILVQTCHSVALTYSPVSLQHAILDDNIEVVPIYRSRGTVEKPIRPHENHDLPMEQGGIRPLSQCKQPVLSKAVSSSRSLATKTKIQGMQYE